MATTLGQFWNNPTCHEDTKILEKDYDILAEAGLLIPESEKEQENENNLKQLHPELPAEPFMGNIENADIYIFMLNPRTGTPYADEYKNWRNSVLLDKWRDNLEQKPNRKYPFYYLDPELLSTGGGQWWMFDKSLYKIIQKLEEEKIEKGSNIDVLELVAQHICSIELCPYHSNSAKWNKKQKEYIYSLPSVQETINFLRDYVIPRVIANKSSLIITRAVSDINKLLGVYKFIYNGKEHCFYDLETDFPDRVTFYKTPGLAQSASLNPEVSAAKGGKIIVNTLKKLI